MVAIGPRAVENMLDLHEDAGTVAFDENGINSPSCDAIRDAIRASAMQDMARRAVDGPIGSVSRRD